MVCGGKVGFVLINYIKLMLLPEQAIATIQLIRWMHCVNPLTSHALC